MNDRNLRICIFLCCNSMDTEQLSSRLCGTDAVDLKMIGLPCSGKVDVPYLMKAFETGSDGVVIITCREDECRNLEGNKRARKRAEAVVSLLEEIGIDGRRVSIVSPKEGGDEAIVDCIRDLRNGLANLPRLSA